MVVAAIDRDYVTVSVNKVLDGSEPLRTRVGRKFEMITAEALIGEAPKVRWRTKTDDGDLCYGGWLLNDSEGEVQLEVLRYCEHDVGATIIEVWDIPTGTWATEIG